MELSKLQAEILNKTDKKIIVMASAAAGKTMLLTEKVRRILQSGADPKDIAVITFTNLAAEELRQRLGDDYKNGIFIGTVHSLANNFLRAYGVDTSDTIEKEKFDKLFNLVEQYPKCIRQIDYLLLDEAQDTDENQFNFIFDMINPSNFFVVGDVKQCIYQFNFADPELLMNLARDKEVKTYSLNENYRNGKEILDFAKDIINPTGYYDNSIAMKKEKGKVIEIRATEKTVAQGFKNYENYGNWAVLCRSNNNVETMIQELKKLNIPCDTFKQGDLTKKELSEKMKANTVKVLTIHSSKGLEWDNIIVMQTKILWGEQANESRNLLYVAATRARNRLFWNRGKPQNKIKRW